MRNIKKDSIAAIVLTYNEEKNIKMCLDSLDGLATKIFVIDSFSTDKTEQIVKTYRNTVFIQHAFVNQSKQIKFALDTIDFDATWLIRLDADEVLTEESSKEIKDLVSKYSDSDINGLVLRYKCFFLGKPLKWGGYYPSKKMTVIRIGKAIIEDKEMDEHFILTEGKSVECKKDSLHENFNTIYDWIDKHNKYSSREVNDYLQSSANNSKKLNKHSKKKSFFKKIYYKFPTGLRSTLLYFYRYYIRLGFLDGRIGKYYAFLQAKWYRYLVDIKIFEEKNHSKSK